MYILLRLILSWQSSCLSTLLHRSPKKKLFSEQNVFSCEAQLNKGTCLSVSLSVCLSVRLWSNLNFSLFGQLMTTYDNL